MISKVKRQPSEWDKIIANETTDKEFISKIYKQLNSRKMKNPIKKWVEDLNRQFSKKTYRWPMNTWKDAQHDSLLKKCKSKLLWGIISCWSEWLPSKSLQTINAGESVEKREPSHTVGGNSNWYSPYGEQCGDSLKHWKHNCHTTQQSHCSAYTPRKPELKETHVPQCLLQHCFQRLGHGSNLDVLSIDRWMDKEVVVHKHNGILLSYKKNAFKSILLRWTNLDPIIHSEVRQKFRETPIEYINAYIWNLEKW